LLGLLPEKPPPTDATPYGDGHAAEELVVDELLRGCGDLHDVSHVMEP